MPRRPYYANWTSYPEYAYEQFYRMNPDYSRVGRERLIYYWGKDFDESDVFLSSSAPGFDKAYAQMVKLYGSPTGFIRANPGNEPQDGLDRFEALLKINAIIAQQTSYGHKEWLAKGSVLMWSNAQASWSYAGSAKRWALDAKAKSVKLDASYVVVPFTKKVVTEVLDRLRPLPLYGNSTETRRRSIHNGRGRRGAKRNPVMPPCGPVTQPWCMPDNAGPYLPQMYPTGVAGAPEWYDYNPFITWPAKPNKGESWDGDWCSRGKKGSGRYGGYTEAERGKRSSKEFLIPERRSWPAGDPPHACFVIKYMCMGRGRHHEYPMLIMRLADVWPPENPENNGLWAMYEGNRRKIEEQAGRMPSVVEIKARRARSRR